MTLNDIRAIGVIGAGQMGSGIAQVCATAGYQVVLHDISPKQIEKGTAAIKKSLDRFVAKKIITEQQASDAQRNLKTTSAVGDLQACDFAIEAATERVDLKLVVFKELDKTLRPNAVLSSNTSSIPITKLAAATSRPDKVVGMHFMNPPALMKLVEIVPGLDTSEETQTLTTTLAEKLGKIPVKCVEQPGFIVNRILLPMINEAIYTLQEGLATAEDIDKAMKLGTNQPMGPLALADLIGLDVCLAILEVMHHEIGDPKFRPAPLLRKYVDAGHLGQKTGRGFYRYNKS